MSAGYYNDLYTDEQNDFYDLLGVDPQAGQRAIEAAYRRLAWQYHPDHNSSPQATGQMQELNKAFSTLRDPNRRREYDLRLAEEWNSGADAGFYYEPGAGYSYGENIRQTWGESKSWARKARFEVFIALVVACAALGWVLLSPSQIASSSGLEAKRPAAEQSAPALFQDDFDHGPARWSLQSPWHFTSRVSDSGMYSLWMGQEETGRYKANLRASATLKEPVDLTGAARPVLRLRLKGQSDQANLPGGEDRLLVEIGTPGQGYTTVYTAAGLYRDWQEVKVDLSRWSGQMVNLRLTFISGSLNNAAGFSGFFVDDVRIESGIK